jgi:hypothetical protein
MNEHEFAEIIIPLENMFEKLGTKKANEYFIIFRNFPMYSIKDSVRWLMKNHTYKRFPFPAEIEDAIREVDRDRSYATAEDLDALSPKCDGCGGTGWKIIEREEKLYPNEKRKEFKHDFATFCSCAKGKMMQRSHRVEIEEARGRKDREIEPPLEYSEIGS